MQFFPSFLSTAAIGPEFPSIMAAVLSLLATITILRTTIKEIIPQELRDYLWNLTRRFSSEFTMVIEETHDGYRNHLYKAAFTYLSGHVLASPSGTVPAGGGGGSPQRITVGKSESLRNLTYGLDKSSEVVDFFHGVPMKWKFNTNCIKELQTETRRYELCFNRKHVEMVNEKYLPHVLHMAKKLKDETRTVKFYTIRRDWWGSGAVSIDHPMTFDTLAMDGDLKKSILEDLNSFINGKEYYKKIGKVYKRGYLLYGPPGTGKSSLIAAMANHLNFDIYNLNLSAVKCDSVLEDLLIHVSNRSIIVVEDIDCNIKLQNRESGDQADCFGSSKVTLSGILNAIDGLLSCCGSERIIVFTTNYRDRIDPALLRAGRMDKHICLSYCTFSTFKQLAANYLDIFKHDLFPRIEELIADAKASPAEVAGELMKSKDPDTALESLIEFLETKGTFRVEDIYDKRKDEKCSVKVKLEGKKEKSSSNSTMFVAVGSNSVGEYTVEAKLAHILKAVFLKHGNIVANCSLRSMSCISSLLEVICRIIERLQAVEFGNLTEIEIGSMLAGVNDLESVKVEVGWLRKRLDEICEALKLAKECSSLKEEMSKNVSDIEKLEKVEDGCEESSESLEFQEAKAQKEKVSETITSIEKRLSQFNVKCLTEGLV